MTKTYQMARVNRENPCPVCGHPDWCGMTPDGEICICMRTAEGSIKHSRNGGYVHRLRDDHDGQRRPPVRTLRIELIRPRRNDLDQLAMTFERSIDPEQVVTLADSLGLSVGNLRRLRIGWDRDYHCFAFPMLDADGRVMGIRLRLAGGRKLSIRGGREGLFIPEGLTYRDRLLICEGPTDTAAMLDLGFEAVGRPSCCGGTWLAVELVRRHWPLDVVIVSDADDPGIQGAERLAETLTPYAQTVRVIRPPAGVKDARAWKLSGATAADVHERMERSMIRTLSVKGVVR